MRDALRVWIGWDPREADAYAVCEDSLRAHSTIPLSVNALDRVPLELHGVLRRPVTRLPRGRSMVIGNGKVERRIVTAAQRGQLWDEVSQAPMSTEFANSRFAVPILAQRGWALFTDCDMLWLADIAELAACADPEYALMCVQHGVEWTYGTKMDGQQQLPYLRKNWSSVMLFNCDHPAMRGLTLEMLNSRPGRDLHRFCWLDDRYIGALPPEWNWLVNVQPKPAAPKLAHYTLGGPWLPGWSPREHDELWLSAAQDLGTLGRAGAARRGETAL